jgi:uncharacterized protein YqgV (UPF0045/DUF77 family)
MPYDGEVTQIWIEFTVAPVRPGAMGPHVVATLESLRAAGLTPEVGALGITIEGEAERLLEAMNHATVAAFSAGAVAVSLSAQIVDSPIDEVEEFLMAVRPIARAIGSNFVDSANLTSADVPLRWKGRVVAGLRVAEIRNLRVDVSKLVAQIEYELGGKLTEINREDKQRAVALLDERGVFTVRNAVDEVADAMGVSRVTVYNYLNATRASVRFPREAE